MYIDAKSLYGWAMSEYLPYDESKYVKNVNLEDVLNTPDNSDIGYFIEVDSKYPDNIKEKTKKIHLLPKIKKNQILMILVIISNRLYLILRHKMKN